MNLDNKQSVFTTIPYTYTSNQAKEKMSRMFKMIGIQNVLKMFSHEETPRSTFVSYAHKSSYSLDEGMSGFYCKIVYYRKYRAHTHRM